jgi:hypothetical protein
VAVVTIDIIKYAVPTIIAILVIPVTLVVMVDMVINNSLLLFCWGKSFAPFFIKNLSFGCMQN